MPSARAARIHRMESMPRRQKVGTFDIERQAGQGPCVLNAYWHYSQPAKRQATDSASAARTGEEMVLAAEDNCPRYAVCRVVVELGASIIAIAQIRLREGINQSKHSRRIVRIRRSRLNYSAWS